MADQLRYQLLGDDFQAVVITGPGKVWIQTLPVARLANRILAAAGSARGEKRRGGPLGDLLQGDG